MHKDPTAFRERFKRWKAGAKPYKYGIPYEEDLASSVGNIDKDKLPKFGGGTSPYRYVLTDDGLQNRVTNDAMGRVFLGLEITPLKTNVNPTPAKINNSIGYLSSYDPNAIRAFTDYLPIVGSVLTGIDAIEAAKKKEYGKAAGLAATIAIPSAMGKAGTALTKPLGVATKAVVKNVVAPVMKQAVSVGATLLGGYIANQQPKNETIAQNTTGSFDSSETNSSFFHGRDGSDDENLEKVPSSRRARAFYNRVDPRGDMPSGYFDAARREIEVRKKMYSKDIDRREYELEPELADSVSDAAWRKRLGYSYNNKFLIQQPDGSVRLPKQLESEIPTDTTMLKKRIEATNKLMNYSRKYKNNKYVRLARDVDQQALDALRETYKTGKPVTINEHSFNSRQWVRGGEVMPTMSPLNVLGNYEIQYDKTNNRINYSDTYDFNKYDWGVPGYPFPIRGFVLLP